VEWLKVKALSSSPRAKQKKKKKKEEEKWRALRVGGRGR
jgi:hypothetical protein